MSKHKDLRILENTGKKEGVAVTDCPQGVPRVVRANKSLLKPHWSFLCTLATDPPGQLDVLGHDGDTLGVDGAQVGVLEQPNQVGLAGLLKKSGSEATKYFLQRDQDFHLQGTDGSGLEPQVSLEILSNLPDQPLEGQLADQQLGGLLVTPDLTESDCAGPVPMGLLHSSCGRSRLPGCLRCQLFPGRLASCRLTRSLLRTSHLSAVSATQ